MEWIVENLFSLLSVISLAVGGTLTLIQWNKSVKLRRAEFISQIIEKLRFDKEMANIMYMIDYDENWYDGNFHGDEKREFSIDKLLSYLSYICYLIDVKHITKKETSILEYELIRACRSYQVQSYLFNLYHWSKRQNSLCSFHYLINYGLNEGIIDKVVFENKNSGKYPRNLNF